MPAKPWTSYANGLAAIAIMLRQTAAPAPFPDLAGAFEWIARRSFLDGISADLECRRIASLAATGRPGGYRQRLGADDLQWARKSFGAPGYTGARTTEQHLHRMLKTLRRADLSAN